MGNYASRNIEHGNGWECPSCTRFIVAGLDCCPNCGEMPSGSIYRSSSSSTSSIEYDSGENPAFAALLNLVGMAVAIITFFVSSLGSHTLNLVMVVPCGVALWLTANRTEERVLERLRDVRRWNGKKDKKISLFGLFLYGVMLMLSAIAYYRIAITFASSFNIMLAPLLVSAWKLFKRTLDLIKTKKKLKRARVKLGSRGRRVRGFSIFLYGAIFVFSAIAFFAIS